MRRNGKPKSQLWLPWTPPVLSFAGWYPCCGKQKQCVNCDPPSTTPLQLQLVMSGWANDDNCVDCASLDGTYVLSQGLYTYLGLVPLSCQYDYLKEIDCGTALIQVHLHANSASLTICPYSSYPLGFCAGASSSIQTSYGESGPIDCSDEGPLEGLVFDGSGSIRDLTWDPYPFKKCDPTGMTATLTVL